MSVANIVLIVLAIVSGSIILMWFAVPPFVRLAQKKGWNLPGIIQRVYEWLNPMDTLSDILVKLKIPGATIFDKIIDVAKEAVGYAEQIAKTGQISPDQRHDEAYKAIIAGLKIAGLTEEQIHAADIQTIIEVGLQSAVNSLGHKSPVVNNERILAEKSSSPIPDLCGMARGEIQPFFSSEDKKTAAKAAEEQIE